MSCLAEEGDLRSSCLSFFQRVPRLTPKSSAASVLWPLAWSKASRMRASSVGSREEVEEIEEEGFFDEGR